MIFLISAISSFKSNNKGLLKSIRNHTTICLCERRCCSGRSNLPLRGGRLPRRAKALLAKTRLYRFYLIARLGVKVFCDFNLHTLNLHRSRILKLMRFASRKFYPPTQNVNIHNQISKSKYKL